MAAFYLPWFDSGFVFDIIPGFPGRVVYRFPPHQANIYIAKSSGSRFLFCLAGFSSGRFTPTGYFFVHLKSAVWAIFFALFRTRFAVFSFFQSEAEIGGLLRDLNRPRHFATSFRTAFLPDPSGMSTTTQPGGAVLITLGIVSITIRSPPKS